MQTILISDNKEIKSQVWHAVDPQGNMIGEFISEGHTIVSADLDQAYRGQGIYTNFLINYARTNGNLYSCFRSPAADKVWKAIKKNTPSDLKFKQTKEDGEIVYQLTTLK